MEKDDLVSYQAEELACLAINALKTSFELDGSLEYFKEAGIIIKYLSNTRPIPEFVDTKVKHRYQFDLTVGWNKTTTESIALASGVEVKANDVVINIDT